MSFPPVPPEIKSVAHILKVAEEHDNRNIVVSYWARMYACQSAMKLTTGQKPPAVSQLLVALLEWLETTKNTHREVEGITNEIVAQAMIEQYCLKLFSYADDQDRNEKFHKSMIKAFYTAGILMDTLEQFGELSEDMQNKRKYAKWKAAYIHNCLKSGDIPTAGGPDEHLNNVIVVDKDNQDDEDELAFKPSGPVVNIPPSTPTDSAATTPNIPGPVPASSPVTPAQPPDASPFPTVDSLPAGAGQIGPDAIQKAQKYCKYASSALNYDDIKTAIDNLNKALNLLQLGKEN